MIPFLSVATRYLHCPIFGSFASHAPQALCFFNLPVYFIFVSQQVVCSVTTRFSVSLMDFLLPLSSCRCIQNHPLFFHPVRTSPLLFWYLYNYFQAALMSFRYPGGFYRLWKMYPSPALSAWIMLFIQFSPLSATCIVLPLMLLRCFKSSMMLRITGFHFHYRIHFSYR